MVGGIIIEGGGGGDIGGGIIGCCDIIPFLSALINPTSKYFLFSHIDITFIIIIEIVINVV